ncbi:hypothetical protein [Burkholderia cepacia]|uniref:hypothetical protein n=1 Tax=Burkholderia cepacia TaxID=292 RepID=UPI00075EBF78|nr:hypothetical protein [Burkholderia cepacia]
MQWILKLPPAILADLLSKEPGELKEVEVAVREALEGLYSADEIESMKNAAGLDGKLSEGKAVARVRKI